MELVQVKDKPGLAKDPSSGAIVNTDDNAFRIARATKRKLLQEKQKTEQLEQRVAHLELLVTKFLEKEIEHG